MSNHFVNVHWESQLGIPGTDESVWNPLNRAINRLFSKGSPLNGLCQCFFQCSGIARWFGVFVHSDGDRVIYFPGDEAKQCYLAGDLNPQRKVQQPFKVDHISLERDRKSWHFTAPKSSDHAGKSFTLELGQSRIFWLGISVDSEELLMPLFRKTRLRFPVPERDAQRRIDSFIAARDNLQFPLITLNSEVERLEQPSFLHFSVIVGPSGFEQYTGPFQSPPPSCDMIFRPQEAEGEPVPIRTYRFSVSDEVDIQIDASEVAGKLKMPFVYSSPDPRSPMRDPLSASIRKGLVPITKKFF